jgi:four helix bundle protein
MRDHTKLRAFVLADEVALAIYKVTRDFPKEEIYGLGSQMRRAGVSIPSNIVEGCTRLTLADYRRFIEIAYGSLKELHYQYSLAERLGYIKDPLASEGKLKITETEKVLGSLLHTLWKTKLP